MTSSDYLVRDGNGEPVMRQVERDRYGRFITPYYTYIWKNEASTS
jgi:hypothetical protein